MTLAIAIYDILVHLAAPFSRKPRKWWRDTGWSMNFSGSSWRRTCYIWFHAASFGEFEQGRPLIEKKIRAKYPDYGILLTFSLAVGLWGSVRIIGGRRCLLLAFRQVPQCEEVPDIVNPRMAFFSSSTSSGRTILDELHKRRIPVYSISSIFRRGQVFLVVWRYVQTCAARLRPFVCAEWTLQTLSGEDRYQPCHGGGDTCFDRVLQIREEAKHLPLVELLKNNTMTFFGREALAAGRGFVYWIF